MAKSTLTYGLPITLEEAKAVMAAAEKEAKDNDWAFAIAIVDAGGHLVLFQKMDGVQLASVEISKGKALSSINFKRPTKAIEDLVNAGGPGLRLLAIDGMLPLEGGEPIIKNGAIIGAIGVSGMQSNQDGQVARAGAAIIK